MNITLNGNPAYKINAKLITSTDKALYLDCEGDKIWIPRKLCKFNGKENTLIIIDWFYNQKFNRNLQYNNLKRELIKIIKK